MSKARKQSLPADVVATTKGNERFDLTSRLVAKRAGRKRKPVIRRDRQYQVRPMGGRCHRPQKIYIAGQGAWASTSDRARRFGKLRKPRRRVFALEGRGSVMQLGCLSTMRTQAEKKTQQIVMDHGTIGSNRRHNRRRRKTFRSSSRLPSLLVLTKQRAWAGGRRRISRAPGFDPIAVGFRSRQSIGVARSRTSRVTGDHAP